MLWSLGVHDLLKVQKSVHLSTCSLPLTLRFILPVFWWCSQSHNGRCINLNGLLRTRHIVSYPHHFQSLCILSLTSAYYGIETHLSKDKNSLGIGRQNASFLSLVLLNSRVTNLFHVKPHFKNYFFIYWDYIKILLIHWRVPTVCLPSSNFSQNHSLSLITHSS